MLYKILDKAETRNTNIQWHTVTTIKQYQTITWDFSENKLSEFNRCQNYFKPMYKTFCLIKEKPAGSAF